MNKENGPIIVIGSSTGGPQTLRTFLSAFQAPLPCPLVVVQHMPPKFTWSFARGLDRLYCGHVVELQQNEHLNEGTTYVAPGGYRATIRLPGESPRFKIEPPTPEDRFAPAIDPMLKSAASRFGRNTLAIIVSGISPGVYSDGVEGCRAVKEQGGTVFVENPDTAICGGMPRDCRAYADRVLDSAHLAPAVEGWLLGRGRS